MKTHDLDDAHMTIARARCRACGQAWVAVFPVAADPDRLECPSCGAQDSEVLE